MTDHLEAERSRRRRILELAGRIRRNPDDPSLDALVCELKSEFGEEAYDEIIDLLTEDVSYSQSKQDEYNRQGIPAELHDADRSLPVSLVSELRWDATDQYEIDNLIDGMIPGDVRALPREAGLSKLERKCWIYVLRGYSSLRIANDLYEIGYKLDCNQVRAVLASMQRKMLRCGVAGWRTSLAYDRARGPLLSRRPELWSRAGFILDLLETFGTC